MIERTSTQIRRSGQRSDALQQKANLPLFEIASMLVPLDHVASFIINASHGIM
jgi:hypothetical protein